MRGVTRSHGGLRWPGPAPRSGSTPGPPGGRSRGLPPAAGAEGHGHRRHPVPDAGDRAPARRAAVAPSVTRWTSSVGTPDAAGGGDHASTASAMVTSTPFGRSEVTGLSAIPHGTMWSNMARSVVTLRANPWVVRPRDVRTPMAAIFRGPGRPGRGLVQTDPHPGIPGQPADPVGREPEGDQRFDDDLFDPVDVARARAGARARQ